jgi:nicotinic acid mononucleotide adenylyltransferase
VPELPGVSSSIIRERVKKGLSIAGLVPEKVRRYIEKNKLYQ